MGFAGAAPPRAASAPAAATRVVPARTLRPRRSSVVLVFIPTGETTLASIPGMSVGIMSATQGSYSAEQLLLDITQGARIANSAYSPRPPPVMSLSPINRYRTAGTIAGWQAARTTRRSSSPAAASRPARGTDPRRRRLRGSDRDRHTSTRSRPPIAAGAWPPSRSESAPTLLARIAALRRRHRLVVADLPAGRTGVERSARAECDRVPRASCCSSCSARARRGDTNCCGPPPPDSRPADTPSRPARRRR